MQISKLFTYKLRAIETLPYFINYDYQTFDNYNLDNSIIISIFAKIFKYMKIRKIINAYWQQLLLLLMAVAVFCFWGYMHPEKVIAREAFQMFLWNGDYIADRIAVPGGFARYSSEFLVQFFKFITLGAAIYALLFTSIQWFSWILLKRALPAFNQVALFIFSILPTVFLWFLACNMDVATTLQMAVFFVLAFIVALPQNRIRSLICSLVMIPVGFWLIGPLVILVALYHLRWLREKESRMKTFVESAIMTLLLVASVIVSSKFVPYPLEELSRGVDYVMVQRNKYGTDEEIKYDYLLRLRAWEEIVDRSYKEEPKSQACKNVVLLAKYYTKRCSDEELKLSLQYPNKVLTSGIASMMMSDHYLHMGFTNMSQRAAFEVMECTSNYNKSAREMVRLVETNLIIGEYDVALKYISILEQTLFYRSWAILMKDYAMHPEKIKDSPLYGPLQEIYGETVDVFFL